jgi:hypothetical protein
MDSNNRTIGASTMHDLFTDSSFTWYSTIVWIKYYEWLIIRYPNRVDPYFKTTPVVKGTLY